MQRSAPAGLELRYRAVPDDNGLIKSQQSEDDPPIDITKGDLEIELVYKALARLISLVYDSESK